MKPEWGATNYLFNDKLFFLNSKTHFPASIPDGTSNTIGIGETLKGDGKTKAVDVSRQYVLLKKDDLKKTGPDTGVEYFKDNKNIAGDRCASWMDGRFLQGTFNSRLQPNDERPDVSCGGVSGVSALRSFDDVRSRRPVRRQRPLRQEHDFADDLAACHRSGRWDPPWCGLVKSETDQRALSQEAIPCEDKCDPLLRFFNC